MTSSKLSKKFDSPLIINIKVSMFLGGLLAVSHVGAGALVWMLPWPVGAQAALTAGMMVSLYREMRRHALRQGPKAITGLEIDTDGDYSLRVGQGDWTACRYVESFRSEWLVIVRLKLEGTSGSRVDRDGPSLKIVWMAIFRGPLEARRRSVNLLLARDAVEPNVFRELRARLHFQVAPQES